MKAPGLVALILLGGMIAAGSGASVAGETGKLDEPPVAFTDAFLADPDNYALGKEVWQDQCRYCHGKSA